MKKLTHDLGKRNPFSQQLADDRGSVLIVALLVLVILAMMGAVASNMSITEIQSSANERRFNQTFYAAESGWQEVAPILNKIVDDAPDKDSATNLVDLSAMDNTPNEIDGIPYEYKVTELGNRPAPGSGDEYREFQYQVDSFGDGNEANHRQQIRVVLNKIYKVQ